MSSEEGDRIEQLEARVEELEAQGSLTSGTVPISRRGLLKGSAALGIGALGGSVLSDGNSGRVAAQTASGQVGTDTDRVDVYSNLVDAASVNTEEGLFGGHPWYDIQKAGAVPDGSTDNTDVFKSVFDEIESQGGGRIYIPDGEYVIGPIEIPSNTLIDFESHDAALLAKEETDGENWSLIGARSSSSDRAENIHLRNGTIDGRKGVHVGADAGGGSIYNYGDILDFVFVNGGSLNNMNVVNAPSEAIDLDYSKWWAVRDCVCTNAGGFGIHVSEEMDRAVISGNFVEGCGFDTDRAGIDQYDTAQNNVYVGNIAKDNRQNYNITGSGAEWWSNQSLDSGDVVSNDVLTGVSTRFESGVETFTGTDASDQSDATWNSYSAQSITVDFEYEFSSSPNVVAVFDRDIGHTPTISESRLAVGPINTDSFNFTHYQYAPTNRSSDDVAVRWFAVDQP